MAAKLRYSHNFYEAVSNSEWSMPYTFFLMLTISYMMSMHSTYLPWFRSNLHFFVEFSIWKLAGLVFSGGGHPLR